MRSIAAADLAAVGALGRRFYRGNRRREAEAAVGHGFPALLRERDGRATGYFLPGRRGHGLAETEDALALIGEAARRLAPEPARFFCPLSEAGFYRRLLASGCRTTKLMTYMALGPYEPPAPVWLPSVLC